MREFINELKKYATPVNTAIIILNIVVIIAQAILDEVWGVESFTYTFSLAWWKVFDEKQYYRLLTYMFLHAGFSHIFNNMIVLGFVGSTAERMMGSFRYAVAYISSGLVAGLASCAYNRWCWGQASEAGGYYNYSLGASGAVFGAVGTLIFIVIIKRGRVAGITLRQLILFLILSVYAGLTSTGIDNAAHIAGVLFGFVSAAILYNRQGGYA